MHDAIFIPRPFFMSVAIRSGCSYSAADGWNVDLVKARAVCAWEVQSQSDFTGLLFAASRVVVARLHATSVPTYFCGLASIVSPRQFPKFALHLGRLVSGKPNHWRHWWQDVGVLPWQRQLFPGFQRQNFSCQFKSTTKLWRKMKHPFTLFCFVCRLLSTI